jgi:hypothetical protein
MALSLVSAAIIAALVQLRVPVDSSASIYGAAISSYNGHRSWACLAAPTHSSSPIQWTLVRGLHGRQTIQVSYDGRVTEAYVFELQHQHAKRIAVLLDVAAEDLDALVVEAREANIWRDLGGFYERRQEYAGFAHFFTREEISHMRARTLSSLLTAEGIVTRCSPACWPMRMNRGRLCQVSISVNGVSQREPDYNGIAIADVTGVEVYRGVPPADLSRSMVPNSSPSSIWMGTGMSAAGQCGLVEIWTR